MMEANFIEIDHGQDETQLK